MLYVCVQTCRTIFVYSVWPMFVFVSAVCAVFVYTLPTCLFHSNAINEALFARVADLSQTKSASNAMEKCLRFCTQQQRDQVADKVCGEALVAHT